MGYKIVRCPRCSLRLGYVVQKPQMDVATGRETAEDVLDIRVTLGLDPSRSRPEVETDNHD